MEVRLPSGMAGSKPCPPSFVYTVKSRYSPARSSAYPAQQRAVKATAKLKRQRLTDIVASLQYIDGTFAEMHAALQEMSSSSRFVSESEEDRGQVSVSSTSSSGAASTSAAAAELPFGAVRLDRSSQLQSANYTEQQSPRQLRVCTGKACAKNGALDLLAAAQLQAAGSGIDVVPCKCLDNCKKGPNVQYGLTKQKGQIQNGVRVGDLATILYS